MAKTKYSNRILKYGGYKEPVQYGLGGDLVQGAIAGAGSGAAGGLTGMGIGAGVGLLTAGANALFGNKDDEAAKQLEMQQNQLNYQTSLNNTPRLLKEGGELQYAKWLSSRIYDNTVMKDGGEMRMGNPTGHPIHDNTKGIINTPKGTALFEGETHENGGIELGNTGVEVEHNEVSIDEGNGKKFVLTNSIPLKDSHIQEHNLDKKYVGKTPAEIYKSILKKTDLRKNDPITEEYRKEAGEKLVNINKKMIFNKNLENITKQFANDPEGFQQFMSNIGQQNEVQEEPVQAADGIEIPPKDMYSPPVVDENWFKDVYTKTSNDDEINQTPLTSRSLGHIMSPKEEANMYSNGDLFKEPTKYSIEDNSSFDIGNNPPPKGMNKNLQFGLENAGNIFDVIRGAAGSINPEKENLGRVTAQNVSLDKLDPTQALKQVQNTYRGASQDLKNSGVGLASYLNNRLGLANAEAESESNVASQYGNQNIGISNQQTMANAAENSRVGQINQNIYAQEQDLNDRNKAQALNTLQSGLDKSAQSLTMDRYIKGKENMQNDLIQSGVYGTKDLTWNIPEGMDVPVRMFKGSDGVMRSSVPIPKGKYAGHIMIIKDGVKSYIKQ